MRDGVDRIVGIPLTQSKFLMLGEPVVIEKMWMCYMRVLC